MTWHAMTRYSTKMQNLFQIYFSFLKICINYSDSFVFLKFLPTIQIYFKMYMLCRPYFFLDQNCDFLSILKSGLKSGQPNLDLDNIVHVPHNSTWLLWYLLLLLTWVFFNKF